MTEPTGDGREQQAIPQTFEHMPDTSDHLPFEDFSDETESMDEKNDEEEDTRYDSPDAEICRTSDQVDHGNQETGRVHIVTDTSTDDSEVDGMYTLTNGVRQIWPMQMDAEVTDLDSFQGENKQFLKNPNSIRAQGIAVTEGTIANGCSLNHTQTASGLQKYRPSADDLILLDQRCKNLASTSHVWSISASWPPPSLTVDMPSVRPDVVPPVNSPLHVQIQAYALRWGTWVTTIKDDARREELLKWVTEKMRAAWETAIKEGYHPRPNSLNVQIDSNKADDNTKQRGRKRTQSPSRQAVPFAYEGKDPCAITFGELNKAGVSIEAINDRVIRRDLDAGEYLLDEVLTNLNQEKIEIKNWCQTNKPSVYGRNLLMYCLFTVQESRHEVQKLERLYPTFKKDVQKKNTQNRIDMYQERAQQHLALAIELNLNHAEDEAAAMNPQEEIANIDPEKHKIYDVLEPSHVEFIESDDPSDEETGLLDELNRSDETDRVSDDVLHQLAQDILSAEDESSLMQAFTVRGLGSENFEQAAIDTESGLGSRKLKQLLQEIHCYTAGIIRMRHLSIKTSSPSEKLKVGHEVRLLLEKVSILRKQLRRMLEPGHDIRARDGRTTTSSTPFQPSSQIEYQKHILPEIHQAIPPSPIEHSITSSNGNLATPFDKSPTALSSMQAVNKGKAADFSLPQVQSPVISQHVPSLINSSTLKEPNTKPDDVLGETVIETTAKQAFIDQFYRPWLNKLLQQRQLPPVQGTLSAWPEIKDILTQLEFGAKERNLELRKFKEGFDKFYEKNKPFLKSRVVVNPNHKSPETPIVTGLGHAQISSSQASSSVPLALQQSIETEILAVIPPEGIPGDVLTQHFLRQVGGRFEVLAQIVNRIAVVGPGNMIYPPPILPQVSTPQVLRSSPNLPMHAQNPMQSSYPTQQQDRMSSTAAPSKQYLHSPTAVSPSSKHTVYPVRSPHSVVTLKTNPGFNPAASAASQQSVATDPIIDEYSTREVNSTRGFSFRYLSGSSREQRERMDDEIEHHINTAVKSRKRKRFGQYVMLHDPMNPKGTPVVHGFWDLDSKGSKRNDIDWFYAGGDMPADWPSGATASDHQSCSQNNDTDLVNQAPEQKKPKIRLNIGSNPRSSAQAAGTAHFDLPDLDAYAYARPQSRTTVKKGVKRPNSGENNDGSRSKKKRRIVIDDDDYDPRCNQ